MIRFPSSSFYHRSSLALTSLVCSLCATVSDIGEEGDAHEKRGGMLGHMIVKYEHKYEGKGGMNREGTEQNSTNLSS